MASIFIPPHNWGFGFRVQLPKGGSRKDAKDAKYIRVSNNLAPCALYLSRSTPGHRLSHSGFVLCPPVFSEFVSPPAGARLRIIVSQTKPQRTTVKKAWIVCISHLLPLRTVLSPECSGLSQNSNLRPGTQGFGLF